MSNTKNIKDKCEKLPSVTQRNECYGAVHDATEDARDAIPASPTVKVIQDQSFDRVRLRHERILEEAEAIASEVESFEAEGSDRPSTKKKKEEGWSEDW